MRDAKKLTPKERREVMPDVGRMVTETEAEFPGVKVIYAREGEWEFGTPDPGTAFKWFYSRLCVSHGVPTERHSEPKRPAGRQKVETRRGTGLGNFEKPTAGDLDL